MTTNRELDALVAEKVMGVTEFRHLEVRTRYDNNLSFCWHCLQYPDKTTCFPASYSSDWAAMGAVLGQISRERYSVRQGFVEALQREVSVEIGFDALTGLVHFSELPLRMRPANVARAALTAVGA